MHMAVQETYSAQLSLATTSEFKYHLEISIQIK
jgi:hypothetical protein